MHLQNGNNEQDGLSLTWLSSSAIFWFMWFFPLSSFSCSWCNTGNYFLYLHSRTECLFILFLYVSHHTSHFSKGWTEGWVRAPLRPESPGLKCSLPCGLRNKARYCFALLGGTCATQLVVCQPLLVPDTLDRCPETVTSFSLLVLLACLKCASQFVWEWVFKFMTVFSQNVSSNKVTTFQLSSIRSPVA